MYLTHRIKTEIYCTYFDLALLLGFSKHVRAICNKWQRRSSEHVSDARYASASYASDQLRNLYGPWYLNDRPEFCGVYVEPDFGEADDLDERIGFSTLETQLDMELRRNLERCPTCGQILDCSELELHELMGCEAANMMSV